MKFAFTLALSALATSVAAGGWNDTTTTTYWITTTDYVTYCPSPTIVTVTTCESKKCAPKVLTVTEETTITITGECIVPTVKPKTEMTTDYITYCPEPTTITVTTCDLTKHCGPHTVEVEKPKTVTVTGECFIPTPGPKETTTTHYITTDYVTYCPEPTTFTYTYWLSTKLVETICEVSTPATVTLTSYVKPVETKTYTTGKESPVVTVETKTYTIEKESSKITTVETKTYTVGKESSKVTVAPISTASSTTYSVVLPTTSFEGVASQKKVFGGVVAAGLALILM